MRIAKVGGWCASVGSSIEGLTAPTLATIFNTNVLVTIADRKTSFDCHCDAVIKDLARKKTTDRGLGRTAIVRVVGVPLTDHRWSSICSWG